MGVGASTTGLTNGAASEAYTVVSTYPMTPFLPSSLTTNPYPFSVTDAGLVPCAESGISTFDGRRPLSAW